MKNNQPQSKSDQRVKPTPPKKPTKPTIPRVLNEKVLNKREISLEIG